MNGFKLNVTDQCCISPATSKGGFSCSHRGDLSRKCHYVTGDVSRESEAQGLLQIVSYLKARFRFLLVRWSFAFARPSRLQRSRSRLVASLADN